VTIPLAPRTARAIDERTSGPLFLAGDGRRLDRHGAARIVRRVTRCAGIAKHVSPHTLRHAFITAALDAGVPLRDVREAASHADPRTTMRGPAWTVMPPTSSPPTLPEQRGSLAATCWRAVWWPSAARLPATAELSRETLHIAADCDREPPFCTPTANLVQVASPRRSGHSVALTIPNETAVWSA
jgi:hypothetical protein